MKYFSKYLPEKGEIKIGLNKPVWDYKQSKVRYFNIETEEKLATFKEMIGYKNGNYSEVKLFLCSRDIQIGDKYFRHGSDEEYTSTPLGESSRGSHGLWSMGTYKVIGEISSEATWVKEGDEFDEYRWIYYPGEDMETEYITQEQKDSLGKAKNQYINEIALKGPCGHFH
jgi:hypothetical protein